MARARKVACGVLVLRRVAAAHMAAVHAQPKVHPAVTQGQALVAALGRRGLLQGGNVLASLDRHRNRPLDGSEAQADALAAARYW